MSGPTVQALRPQLGPQVRIGPPQRLSGRMVHYVRNTAAPGYHRVGAKEHFLMSRMDGSRTLDELEAEYAGAFGRRIGPQGWASLMSMLYQRGLLHTGEQQNQPGPRADGATGGESSQSLLRYRFPVVRQPDRFLGRWLPRTQFLFRPAFVIPSLAAIAAMLGLVGANISTLFTALRGSPHPEIMGAAVLVTIWLIMILHECAHGVACRHFGGSVGEIGVMWRFPLLIPYCKVDDVVLLARRQRVCTAFAGIYVSLVILLPFTLVWLAAPGGSDLAGFCAGLLLFGSGTAVANLIPFLQLDGYFMVSHALGLADLRGDGYRYSSQQVRKFFRRPAAGGGSYSRLERWAYGLYFLASVTFALALSAGLASEWFGWLNPRLGTAGSVLILVGEAALVLGFLWLARLRSGSGSQTPARYRSTDAAG